MTETLTRPESADLPTVAPSSGWAAESVAATVAGCLTRAPSVELVGEAKETGFRDRQWLITRDGRFLQITELLYRILEQADGTRTLDQIAAGVTESTDWLVTADDVRHVAQTKLLPLRLLLSDEPLDSPVTPATRVGGPLGVSLRMRFLGPRFIAPIANVLQWLYWPPVLISLVVSIAVAEWWVYFVHGLGDSIRAAFYTPGALLVVFALVLAAAVFHEFGHASALRYGGGKVRGMGAGLYLLYPVLYSDVTDSYRLGRWGRVRTDLGGFYFHLVFALAMVGLSVITGQEFLLVLVLLINLTILSECLPFVRFDGYWALTDLTGIPDFFSQMGPFLASLLPARTALGTRLPPLKLWVKAVFVTYIVATVPVLAILYLVMVKGLPFVFVNTWDALIYQTELVTFAWSARDFVAITASASQMVFLALPLLASGYLFARVARSVLKLVWRWSKPTAPRRVVGALVTTGAIGLIASVWTPDLQQLSSRWAAPPPPTGVQTFAITERTHVETPVTYAQTPPLGGDHAPVWQNCGFYSVPIANENGVHSMEHGAVWVTYSPDLPADQVEVLRYLAHTERYVLVTPYSNLPSPIVASAWNRQLFLHDTDDPRLNQFIGAFQRGRQAPESGGPCIRGLGEPE